MVVWSSPLKGFYGPGADVPRVMVDLNAAQELFTAFFAIYFSLTIDRSFREYKAYDTYSAWRGERRAVRRLFLAWVFLIVLPLLQYAYVMGLLAHVELRFDQALPDTLAITIIGLLSFYMFGYYRVFEAMIHICPQAFYPKDEVEETAMAERTEFWSHFIPGIGYIAVTLLLFAYVVFIYH